VVWDGETLVEVRAVTGPTPLLMLREVAPLTFQESVVGEPALTVEGLAEKEVIAGGMGGGAEPFTVIVICSEVEPTAL